MNVAGIVLSAGASTRAGSPKALALSDGHTFLERTAAALADLDQVIVVVAAPHASEIIEYFGSPRLRFVENPDPGRGMFSSLQVGLAALPPESDAAVLSLIDHPHVQRASVQCLLEAWRATRAPLVRPMFSGRRGHPIVIDRAAFLPLLLESAEHRLCDALARAGAGIDVEVDDPAILEDIDRPSTRLSSSDRHPRLPP